MATTLTVDSNYAGQVAGEIIGKAFKESDTIKRNLITVIPNIDFQISIRKIEFTNGLKNYACGFVPTGAVILSEKLLTPKKLDLPLEICKETLRQTWSSASMGFSAHNDVMPKDIETALIAEVLGDVSEVTESDIWTGNGGSNGHFGGFIPLFTADADVIKANNGIVPAEAPIDKDNVVSELEKVLNAIPVAVRKSADLVIGVSDNVALAYTQALVSAGINNGLGSNDYQLRYGRYVLEIIGGLPDNTFVAYEKKNLNFGTGLLSDHNELRIKDMDTVDLSGTVRFRMVYTAGVQYANSNEIVWYLSTTAVD